MPGPPPVPNEVKRRRGNPGKRSLPKISDVHAVSQMAPQAPEHLGDDGQAVWQLMTDNCPWIAESDRASMVLLAEKVDRRADFKARLEKSDPVLYTDKGYAYANPLVGMLSTIENEISQLLGKLGLTPADRTRLGVAEVKAKNAFEEMLAKRAKREG